MTWDDNKLEFWRAAQDFQEARRKADMEELMARLTGKKPLGLLHFETVRQQLRARVTTDRGVQDIPLAAVIGSVDRYADFTRDFLPRESVNSERWTRVLMATNDLSGLPPIEVYKLGEVYFVKDGNHRVSVARQLGATHIQAYVIELQTRVPLTPDVQPEELIIKAEYADFLEHTRLDDLRPDSDLQFTEPGRYATVEEHIQLHRYFMGLDFQRDISPEEAVTHWYDTVYLPGVQVIRNRGMLRDFPGRTEADLYLWVVEHRAELEECLGWKIGPEEAATDLIGRFGLKKPNLIAKLSNQLLDSVTPDTLEAGPEPGIWRRDWLAGRQSDHLFSEILVSVNGEEVGWCALEQAFIVARREESRLRGLHVLPEGQKDSEAARAVQAEFDRRCQAAGVAGHLVLESGAVGRTICDRARWVDLVSLTLAYPPGEQFLARLGSGFRAVLRRCPRPVLAVPKMVTPMERALLAYDGSPRAEEALYVATYLAGHWQIPLVVLTILEEGRTSHATQEHACNYLSQCCVDATFVEESGPVASVILETAEAYKTDFIIMGNYGFNPVLEVMLGSAVDQVLRESHRPMLICR